MKIDYIGKCLLIEDSGERVLVIGDLHLGYEGSMRAAGVMIPVKLYEKCVKDFNEIIGNVGGYVEKIVILGDVKHEFGGILSDEWKSILNFLCYAQKHCKELVVIEGNHDNILFPILNKMGILSSDYYLWKNFAFFHGDREFEAIKESKIKNWVMGHGHPAINLSEGVKRESYKCFLIGKFKGKRIYLVPSFFPIIAGTDPREFELRYAWSFDLDKFDVRVIGDNLNVLSFGKLKEIQN